MGRIIRFRQSNQFLAKGCSRVIFGSFVQAKKLSSFFRIKILLNPPCKRIQKIRQLFRIKLYNSHSFFLYDLVLIVVF